MTWDGGPGASTTDDLITSGAGTWTTGVNNWDDGLANSINAAWADGDDATCGGTAGAVSLAAPGVNAHNLLFNTTGFTIQSNTLTLNGGTLSLSHASALAAANTVTLTGNKSTLLVTNNQPTIGAVTVATGATGATLAVNNTGATAQTGYKINGITLNAPLTINYTRNGGQWLYIDNNQKITGSGVAAGQDALIFTQTGASGNPYYQFNAAASNDFTGNVRVESGHWDMQAFGSFDPGTHQVFPTGSMLTLNTGATWRWNNSAAAFIQTVDGLAGGGTMSRNVPNYTLTINADNASNEGARVFTGTLSGMTGTLTLGGTGTQEFSGANPAFTNAPALDNGTLKLTNTTAWGSAITVGASNSPTLQLNAPLAGDSWSFTRQVNGGSANASIEKVGDGTVILSAAGGGSFSGGVKVTSGTLLVDAALPSTGLVQVSAGATLGGSGTLGNVTVAADGIFTPGGDNFEMYLSSLALAPTSIVNLELDDPGRAYGTDNVFITGALTLGGIWNISAPAGGGIYDLTTATEGTSWLVMTYNPGSLTPGAVTIGTAPILADSLAWAVDSTTEPGKIFLTVTVPEPASAGLLVLGAFFLRALRRRK